MRTRPGIYLVVWSIGLSPVAAQDNGRAPPAPAAEQNVVCPPATSGGPQQDLSDKLSQSKGIICVPKDVDPKAEVRPPGGGELKVIPAPGSPGGDPNIQPK